MNPFLVAHDVTEDEFATGHGRTATNGHFC